jgi:Tol biopolymer transport system component
MKTSSRVRAGLLASVLMVAMALASCVPSMAVPPGPPEPSETAAAAKVGTSTVFSSPIQPEPAATPFTSPLLPGSVIPDATEMVRSARELGLGGTIAFHSERSGDFDIWTMSADGSDLRQLTDDPGLDVEPAWSPDGSKIVFATSRDDPENLSLYVMNADGTDQKRLVQIAGGDLMGPALSPDGTRIAFYSNVDGNFELYVSNADGTEPANISNNPANDSRPTWSPAGDKLAFVSDRNGGENLYVLDLGSSQVTRLTEGIFLDNLPKWSPDGKRILFASNRGGQKGLYTVLADGTGTPTPVTPRPENDDSPAWAGDGAFILFSSQRTGDWELYAMRSDGTDARQLTLSKNFDRFPAWKP